MIINKVQLNQILKINVSNNKILRKRPEIWSNLSRSSSQTATDD